MSIREIIWDYTRNNYQCLLGLAEDIAIGIDSHGSHGGISLSGLANQVCQFCADKKCPQPINYLANCVSPSMYKNWLPSGSFKFKPCDFNSLRLLASVKGSAGFMPKNVPEHCGFNTGGTQGLSILLGPWSDYCLWCWAQHPLRGRNAKPILILGKDNDTFSAQTINAGRDWGEEQVMDTAKISKATDRSTQQLFGAIETKASSLIPKMTAAEFIAENRIFIYNIWPWFRCGDKSAGDFGIHRDFSKIPGLWYWLDMLVKCLKPKKIVALGGWSYNSSSASLDSLLRKMLPNTLTNGDFPPGSIDVFRHPSARNPNGWSDPWTWDAGRRWDGMPNNESFKEFLHPTIKPNSVLDVPIDS